MGLDITAYRKLFKIENPIMAADNGAVAFH